MNPNNPNAHTDAIRKTIEILHDLIAKSRESGHRAAIESEEAEMLARHRLDASRTYNQHANLLQGTVDALTTCLNSSAEGPSTNAAANMDVETLAYRIKEQMHDTQKHDPHAVKPMY
jgi:hypothetical protein